MRWDDDYFYVGATLHESYVTAQNVGHNHHAPYSPDNDFEIFIDGSGTSHCKESKPGEQRNPARKEAGSPSLSASPLSHPHPQPAGVGLAPFPRRASERALSTAAACLHSGAPAGSLARSRFRHAVARPLRRAADYMEFEMSMQNATYDIKWGTPDGTAGLVCTRNGSAWPALPTCMNTSFASGGWTMVQKTHPGRMAGGSGPPALLNGSLTNGSRGTTAWPVAAQDTGMVAATSWVPGLYEQ